MDYKVFNQESGLVHVNDSDANKVNVLFGIYFDNT